MPKGFIYLLTNNVNRKGYVGQTISTVARRFNQHKHDAKRNLDYSLYRAIRKHGIENFSIEVVAECDVTLLDDLEKHYIKFYGTRSHGYNDTDGGGGMRGWKVSDETRRRLSAAHVGQQAWNKGKKLSQSHKDKLSASHKGKKLPESTRANMRKNRVGMTGKRHSDETKTKISATKRKKRGVE